MHTHTHTHILTQWDAHTLRECQHICIVVLLQSIKSYIYSMGKEYCSWCGFAERKLFTDQLLSCHQDNKKKKINHWFRHMAGLGDILWFLLTHGYTRQDMLQIFRRQETQSAISKPPFLPRSGCPGHTLHSLAHRLTANPNLQNFYSTH